VVGYQGSSILVLLITPRDYLKVAWSDLKTRGLVLYLKHSGTVFSSLLLSFTRLGPSLFCDRIVYLGERLELIKIKFESFPSSAGEDNLPKATFLKRDSHLNPFALTVCF
jgi:hypothetical protein